MRYPRGVPHGLELVPTRSTIVYSARCRSRGPTPVSNARRHSAVASTAAVAGRSCPDAPCGASSRHLLIRDKQSWKETFPTSFARRRKKSLGGGHHEDAAPSPSVRMTLPGCSEERPGPRARHLAHFRVPEHSEELPGSLQRPAGRASSLWLPVDPPTRDETLSSRHSWGQSTCPQKRVFRSFP